jgi:opacity protein-like surface antigen
MGSLALAFTVATAEAQGIRPHFAVGGSITFPTGDYHADPGGGGFSAGWQGMALVEFTWPDSRVGLRVDGTYGRNNANATYQQFGFPDQHTRLLSGNVDVTYEFHSLPSVQPYVLAGIGLYNVKLSMTFSSGGGRDTAFTEFGWNAGAGLRYSVGRAALFLEARYCRVDRILNEGRNYAGTFYHPYGVQVQQVGLTAGIRFGGE